MTIATLPPAPTAIDTPEDFDAKSYALLGAMGPMVTQINADNIVADQNRAAAGVSSDEAAAAAAAAEAERVLAQAAAASAVNGPGTLATSTTSNPIDWGNLTFAIQTGKAIIENQYLTISAGAGQYLYARILSYNSGTGSLTVAVVNKMGSGTYNSWTLAVSGPPSLSPASRLFYAAGA